MKKGFRRTLGSRWKLERQKASEEENEKRKDDVRVGMKIETAEGKGGRSGEEYELQCFQKPFRI